MSIVPGIDGSYSMEELHVFQEMSWKNVDKLIDKFINQYGLAPQEMRVSDWGRIALESGLHDLGLLPGPLSEISQYRGVTVKTQTTFSPDTIELLAFEDKMNEQNLPPNTLRNADGTAYQAGAHMSKQELIEQLADKEHASWARWMSYLFSKCNRNESGELVIPESLIWHWQRQIDTPYAQLSEREKQSDRDEVAHILPIIEEYTV